MLHLEKINALAELDRYGIPYEPAGEEEVRCRCPSHDDEKPSCSLNIVKNLWKCQAASCTAKGDIISLLALYMKVERQVILADLITRYPDLQPVRAVRQDVIEKYHQAIWTSGPFIKELYKRGVTDSDIREWKLGFHEGRIMIPVYDLKGNVINVRKYLPGAPGPEKMRNIKGYKSTALYAIDRMKYPVVWVCGGEMKAIVVNRLLNQHSIGAVCVTAGEGNWDPEFTPYFKDKTVYVCMDVDTGGRVAAKKIANQLCRIATSVGIIQLPLDLEKYPKGDVNDYVGVEGADDKDLLRLMTSASKYTPYEEKAKETKPIECRLIEAAKANNIGVRLSFNAIVVALDEVPFIVPKEVGVVCAKDNNTKCMNCPVYALDPNEETGQVIVTIPSTSQGLLDLIASRSSMEEALPFAIGIPKCKGVELYVKTHYNVFDSRLSAPLEIHGDNREHMIQPAFIVSDRVLDMNLPYRMSGRPFPHPKTAQAVIIVDGIEEREDNLSTLQFSPGEIDALKMFQPEQWTVESLEQKLDSIVGDLSHNVTGIYFRPDLHVAVDLTYHSPLYFSIDGRMQHGWVNCLISGDSSQGKSEVTIRLIEHYGLGTRYDCKNASEAGLLGGLQQLGTRWFISWGVIPIHDRQLVVMEEIKGASEQVLGRLTDMRSSGFAEITKIERRKAHARTRLIMISNPRSDKPVSAYSYGIEVIKELMGSLEDIRRFDFAILLSEGEIDAAKINSMITHSSRGKPLYGSDDCRKCVLWAWTRKPEQVVFDEKARQLCLELSVSMCSEFSETLPLCDKGTMRYKLARLASALACRTFSTEDGSSVVVRPCHVEYIHRFLRRNYSLPHFGYKDFTEAEAYTNVLRDPNIIEKKIKGTKYPREFIEQMLHAETIVLNDICDWCEVQREIGQSILSLLVRKRALFRNGIFYEKSSGFIDMLKKLLATGNLRDNVDEKAEF